MKITIDTNKKEITFLDKFTLEEVMKLSKLINVDLNNWSVIPYTEVKKEYVWDNYYRSNPYNQNQWYVSNDQILGVSSYTNTENKELSSVIDTIAENLRDHVNKDDKKVLYSQWLKDLTNKNAPSPSYSFNNEEGIPTRRKKE